MSASQSNGTFRCMGRTYSCQSDNAIDPDISGIGVSLGRSDQSRCHCLLNASDKVIVSFFATALLTIGAILYGFCKIILPGVRTTRFDDCLLLLIKVKPTVDPKPTATADLERQKRFENALEKFVLASSVQ